MWRLLNLNYLCWWFIKFQQRRLREHFVSSILNPYIHKTFAYLNPYCLKIITFTCLNVVDPHFHIFVPTCPHHIRNSEFTCQQNIHIFAPTCTQDFRSISLARFLQSASSLMRINYLKSRFRRQISRLPSTVHLRQVPRFTNVM